MKFFKYYFAIIVFLFTVNINAQNVIYVTTSGNDSYPGNSLSFPKATLGGAIQAAGNGDTIKFSAGTYMISSVTQIDQGLLDSIVIMGAGKDQTIFLGDSSSAWLNIVNNAMEGDNPNHYVLKDFKVKNMVKSTDPGDVDDNSPYLKGAALYTNNANNILLENIHFEACSASHAPSGIGGALYFYMGYGININNCTFNDNYSRSQGSAISMLYPTVNITNCVFFNNSTNNQTSNLSGTVYFASEGDSLFINHCTFSKNNTFSTLILSGGVSIIKNSILYNTASTYDIYSSATSYLERSFYINQYGLTGVTSSSNDYPRFADSTNYDFRLLGGSPAIDFGEISSANYDIDGYPRNNPDAGAYESHCYTPVTGISLSQISPLSCYGASDGAIQAIVSGGESPFYFGWGSAKETNNLRSVQRNPGITVDSLYSANGDWVHLIVQDAFGCDYSDSIQLSSPAKIMTSIGLTNGIMCHGDSTASISVSASNGASPYTYSFGKTFNGTDLGTGSSASLSLLPADSVFVKVQDNDGCFVYDTINISQPSAVSLHTNSYSPICPGGEGSVSATPSGGMGKFTVEWGSNYGQNDLGTTNGVSSGYSNQLHNVYPGIYAVTVIDSFGCKDSALVTLGNSANTALTITSTQQNVDCYGNSNGLISIIINGGSSPYSIDWVKNTMPNTSIQQVFSSIDGVDTLRNLVAGDYTVTVTDALGCQEISSISVTEPSQFMLTMEVKENVDCYGGANGEAKATISGGTANYTYDWGTTLGGDDIAKHPDKSVLVDSVANLAVGTYHLNITDDNGCSVSDVVTITGPSNWSLSTTGNDTKCEGSSDGSIDFTLSGSNPPYNFYVSSVSEGTDTVFASSGILQGAANEGPETLSAGTYYLFFSDDKGCTFNASGTTVSDPYPLTISPIETYASNLCSGNSNAKVRTYVEMDTEDNFNFYWLKKNEGGTFDTLQNNIKPMYEYDSLENLSGGWYYLHLRDANNCLLEDSIEVAEPNPISTGFEMTQTLDCYGDSNASFEVNTVGGTPSYYYEFGTSHGASDILASESQALTGLSSDSIFLKITDANSCVHYDTVFIDQPPVLQLDLGLDFALCLNKTQTLSPSVSGGTGNITYNWSPSTGLDNSHAANPNLTASTVGVGAYELNLTVVDENGCSNEDSLNYSIYPTLTETINENLCYGDAYTAHDTIITTSGTYVRTYASQVTGCDSVVTYNITVYPSHDTTINEGICDGDVYSASDTSFATSGTYVRTYTSQVTGCDSVVTYNIFVLASLGSVVNASICEGDTYTAGDTTVALAGVYTRALVGSNGCDSAVTYTVSVNPVLTSSVNATICDGDTYTAGDTTVALAGVYTRTLVGSNGCDSTVTYTVSIEAFPSIGLGEDYTVCEGSTVNLDPGYVSGGTYIWSNDSTHQLNEIVVDKDTMIWVEASSAIGCVARDTVNVTIENKAQVVFNDGAGHVVCSDTLAIPLDVVVTDAASMSWSTTGDGSFSDLSISNPVYTFGMNDLNGSTYNLDLTIPATANCPEIIETKEFTAKTSPMFSLTADASTICEGESAALDVASAFTSIQWSTGESDVSSINVTPLVTTEYTVIVEDNGCTTKDTIDITVNALPIVDAGIDMTICEGDSIILSASGANTYTWDNGGSQDQFAHPIVTTTYTVSGESADGCLSTDDLVVTVNTLPVVSAGSNQEICVGNSLALNASGAETYVWSDGLVQGAIIEPTIDMSYSVTGTDTNGCSAIDTINIVVNDSAVFDVSEDAVTCDGSSVNIGVITNMSTYLWSNGETSKNINVVSSGTYIVTVTDANGCPGVDSVGVDISNGPSVNAGGNRDICIGDSLTLSGEGDAQTYAWKDGDFNDLPNDTTFEIQNGGFYTLIGTDENGCSNQEQIIINARALPILIAGNDVSICDGDSVLLMANAGSASIKWNTGDSVDFYVNQAGEYTVEAETEYGCLAHDTINVIVDNQPMVTISSDQIGDRACEGTSFTFNASGAAKYAFYINGLMNQDDSTGVFGPSLYTDGDSVVVLGQNGVCIGNDTVVVTIDSVPNIALFGEKDTLCDNKDMRLNVSGADSYVWISHALSGSNPQVAPKEDTVYVVEGYYANGCKDIDSITVAVIEAPVAVLTLDSNIIGNTICEDSVLTLNATGGVFYEFFVNDSLGLRQASATDVFEVSDLRNQDSVAVQVTSANGCKDFSNVEIINVEPCIGVCEILLADFNYEVSGKTITVMDRSGGNVTDYSFEIKGYTTIQDDTVSYTFDESGYYEVCLTVMDSNTNCSDQYCEMIPVIDTVGNDTTVLCNADFDFTVRADSVWFTNTSQGTFNEMSWSFSGLLTSNKENPIRVFENPGYFEVCLSIFDTISSCQSSTCQIVEIQATEEDEDTVACLADFTSFINIDAKEIILTNKSQGDVSRYYWDFGDGAISFEDNPSHNYLEFGIYEVKLTTNDDVTGCQSEVVKTIEVMDTIADEACIADFDFYVDASEKEIFVEQLSRGDYANVNISFGDGTYSMGDLNHVYDDFGYYEVKMTIFNFSTGCQSTKTKMVEVMDSSTEIVDCQAELSYFPDFENGSLELGHNSIGSPTRYYWEISNGAVSFEENPSIDIAEDGIYEVCLTIINDDNVCQSKVCEQIEFRDTSSTDDFCHADFSFYTDLNEETLYLNNLSSGTITNYYWEFGDGEFSRDSSVNHQYASQGIYKVKLTVYNVATQCHSTSEQVVEMVLDSVACEANFSAMPDFETKEVKYSDQSYGEFDNFYWNFGDGTFSTEKNPTHVYGDYGYYNVCLTVYDEFTQCQDNYCEMIAVLDTSSRPCIASFDVFYDLDSQKVDFINLSEGDYDSYLWNFGDGTYSDEQSPTHTYADYGYYGVSLTVFHRASACQAFVSLPIELLDTTIASCRAYFGFYPEDGTRVQFNNESEGEVSEFFWIFGDGTISRDEHPSHTYSESGVYNVTLNVFDQESQCHNVIEQSVEVIDTNEAYCNGYFTFFPDSNGTVIFTAEATGSVSEYFWSFGDNSYSKDTNVVHAYEGRGYYQVCLTVIDTAEGCIHTYCEEIVAGTDVVEEANCQANFKFYPLDDKNIRFENTSLGNYDISYWDMGDGNYNENPISEFTHQYDEAGYYTVIVSVVDTFGDDVLCFNTYEQVVTVIDTTDNVDEHCAASFVYFPQQQNVVKFSDKSLGNVQTRYWDFGDDSAPSHGKNPSHPFRKSGYYEVCLTVINESGCQETYCQVVPVGNVDSSCFASFNYYVDSTSAFARFNNKSYGNDLSYAWDFGDQLSSIQEHPGHTYAFGDSVYAVCLEVTNPFGCYHTTCKNVIIGNALLDRCLFNCVWPGDANDDLEANHYDLLAIGLNYRRQGPKRDSVSIAWRGHGSIDWSTYQADSTNNRHADCNGDGVVNSLDKAAIDSNFAYSHFRQYRNRASNDEISIVVNGDITPGAAVSIDVIVGDDITPLQMYGIGWELGFEEGEVDYNTVSVSWNDTWLDDEGDDLVVNEWGGEEDEDVDDFWADDWLDDDTLDTDDDLWKEDWLGDEEDTLFMDFTRVDAGKGLIMSSGTRLDKRNVTGAGKIAEVNFIVPVDFDGDSISIGVFSSGGVQATGSEVEFNNEQVVVAVKPISDEFEMKDLKVFPNPSEGQVQFYLDANEIHDIQVIDISGRVVYSQTSIEGGLMNIDLSELNVGIYTLVVNGNKTMYRERIEIIR